VIYLFDQPMPAYHTHQWRVRREWKDADGRLLRHRTCKGCSLEQQVRFVFVEMIWRHFVDFPVTRTHESILEQFETTLLYAAGHQGQQRKRNHRTTM
jgi:hypothetical protein